MQAQADIDSIHTRTISKICPCAHLIKHYAMKMYGGMYVQFNVFLISALAGG
jgi:hypothetical protein